MSRVVKKKTSACAEMAIRGTTAYHHCLVRHQTSATTTRQTPMMLTVAPVHEKSNVTSLRIEVRDDAIDLLIFSSELPRCFRGPSVSAQPTASTTSHHTRSGSSTRTARSRAASLGAGRDWSSRHLVRNVIA